jgi:HEAT repeat protein
MCDGVRPSPGAETQENLKPPESIRGVRPVAKFAVIGLIATCLLAASCSGFAGESQRTEPLIAVLKSNAGLFEKARACQQLGEFGTEAAVPALASLLGDEHLAAYARSGLEGIGGPTAAAALRDAAGRLEGKLLTGVVNSLGVLRDEQAVPILMRLAQQSESGAAPEAFSALGRIANDAALATLKSALSQGPRDLRPAAAAGCLLSADQRLKSGDLEQARALYNAILTANLSPGLRLAATRGAILASGPKLVSSLIERLRSPDPIVRNAALICIRERPSAELASALNAELRQGKSEVQTQLLAALADCHNEGSFALIEEKAASEDPDLRKSALTVLAKLHDPTTAAFLVKAIVANRSPEELSLAVNGIERIEGSSVDDLIIKELASQTDSGARVRLIRLIDPRAVATANDELLKLASDSDLRVQTASFEALKSRCGAHELPALIALTRDCKDDSVRPAAEAAVYQTCATVGDTGSMAVLKELKQADKPEQKNSWVRVLTSLGYSEALPLIEGLMNDSDQTVASNATEQLGQWPSPAPIDALFKVTETSSIPEQRREALNSAIRLAQAAAEEHQRPDSTIVAWFDRASKDCNSTAEKRLIISGLGRVSHPVSLRLLSSYLDQPEVHEEAAVAIVQIAPALAKQGTGAPLEQALEKISTTSKNGQVRDQARKIAQTLSDYKQVVLFDGLSLNGWEGDTNVWRLRDKVIVGGSMAGNPRNEFLATTRSYTNFVLRLEYRLVGTEGFINSGVQFHSVRVVKPPNEMSGYQADIGAGYSGCLYDESRRNKFLVRPPEDQVKRLERPGEWNDYEVRCEGSHIQILLNGENTVDYSEPDGTIPHTGLIGLQIHGGSKAEVSFRKICIVELPR